MQNNSKQPKTWAEQCADIIWAEYEKKKEEKLPRGRKSTADDLADWYAEIGIQPDCHHVWKTYYGFTRAFEYCAKCDAKRELSNGDD